MFDFLEEVLRQPTVQLMIAVIAIGISMIAMGVSYQRVLAMRRNRNDIRSSDRKFTREEFPLLTIRSCPNPNCIRCQRYKIVHQSANKKLPQLIHQLKNKEKNRNRHHHGYNDNDNINDNSIDNDNQATNNGDVEDRLKRIIEGVNCGPPPLPTAPLPVQVQLQSKSSKNMSQWQNATNQYPTVCFIPHLPVHTNATRLHPKACKIIKSQSSLLPSIIELIMDEYIESQFNGGQWQTNDSAAALNHNPESNTHYNNNQQSQLWEVLYLMNQGQWMHDNIQRCPQTLALIKKMPGLMQDCMFGNIFFSVLYPGTKIEQHCGPTNVRHRMHFPLLVPEPGNHSHGHGARLKVNDEIFTWKVGEPFVFDDSLAHAAEYPANDGSEVRVVLVVDLWHADLSDDEKGLISDLYPSVSSSV